MKQYDLNRFKKAQERDYKTALAEIRAGRKRSHWMWYIFPQIAGLGYSSTSKYYAIADLGEAGAYMDDPLLRARLIEISQALLALPCTDACRIMGAVDDKKLCSSMTLFMEAAPDHAVFKQVLDKFYGGKPDKRTLELIGKGN